MSKACSTCSAFFPINANEGQCRAHPPVPVMVGIGQRPQPLVTGRPPEQGPIINSYFPALRPTFWCREWQPKVNN